jgi:hypothetical protein
MMTKFMPQNDNDHDEISKMLWGNLQQIAAVTFSHST